METTIYWGYIRIMENKMETTIYWGYIGIMENKMEATIYWGYIGVVPLPNTSSGTLPEKRQPLYRHGEGPIFFRYDKKTLPGLAPKTL